MELTNDVLRINKLKTDIERLISENATLRGQLARKTAECTVFFDDGVEVRSRNDLLLEALKDLMALYETSPGRNPVFVVKARAALDAAKEG